MPYLQRPSSHHLLTLTFTLLTLVVSLLSPSSPPPFLVARALPTGLTGVHFSSQRLHDLREQVRRQFHHGYDNYLRYAFPHDELKPISRGWTDSLSELGNSARVHSEYHGVAMTMIDSLSTLAVLGNRTEFARAVDIISSTINFDIDVRVNLFEANIRLLGGLLSAHILALDPGLNLHPTYNGALLPLAKDLGDRFLPAFVNVRVGDDDEDDEVASNGKRRLQQLPYAWINLKKGVEPGETAEQCTAGIGTLLIEFGLLSYLVNDTIYYDVAERSLFALWRLRDPRTNLLGNSLSCETGDWWNQNAGVSAGIDSFYEYAFKSSIFFGNAKFLHIFEKSYESVQKYLKYERDWLIEADMHTGSAVHVQFNSLTCYFPGLQSMIGDIESASATHENHFTLWNRYDGVPERYLLQQHTIHSTERHYILRPEMMESTYLLYRATKNTKYLEMGVRMLESIEKYARVSHGYAALRDLEDKSQLEDRMNSFFLAETVKYLYLLFDEENWVHTERRRGDDDECAATTAAAASSDPLKLIANTNWIFTTEGHLLPILPEMHRKFGDLQSNDPSLSSSSIISPSLRRSKYSLYALPHSRMNRDTREYHETLGKRELRNLNTPICPVVPVAHLGDSTHEHKKLSTEFLRLAHAYQQRLRHSTTCTPTSSLSYLQGDFQVKVSEGVFSIVHIRSKERMDIKNLGTNRIEITNRIELQHPQSVNDRTSVGGASDTSSDITSSTPQYKKHILLRPIIFDQHSQSYGFKLTSSINLYAYQQLLSNGLSAKLPSAVKKSLELFHKRCNKEFDGIGSVFSPDPTPIDSAYSSSPSSALLPQRFSSYNSSTYLLSSIVLASPLDACTPSTRDYTGKLVLVQRGSCTFIDKMYHIQTAGGVGVVVMNTDTEEDGYKIMMMGVDGSEREIRIPSMMIPHVYAQQVRSCIEMHEEVQRTLKMHDPDYVPQEYRMEMLKYYIAPTSITPTASVSSSSTPHSSSTSSSSTLHPRVIGDLQRFFVTSIGGFTVEIEEKNQSFMLKLY